MRSLLRHLPVRITIRLHDAARAIRLRRHWQRKNPAPIALVSTHELSLSGAPRVALDVARVLRDGGHQIIVISQSDGPMRVEFEQLGALVLIDLLPGRNRPYLHWLAERAEVAFANTVLSASLVDAWAARVPTCWYLHELSAFETLAAAGVLANPLAGAARVWAGSELCARLVRPYRADVMVLPYGLEPIQEVSPNRSSEGEEGRLQIGIFGSIEPRKGQDLALDGLAMLDPADRAKLRLHLYGRQFDRELTNYVLQQCDTMPEASFDGELDAASYRTALARTDCILISSREDTAPLVSIDALSAGRVLLLTRAVGTSAWLSDGIDALIEEQADVSAMARLFRRALATRPYGAEIGAAAKASFDANFSLTAFATRLNDEFALAKSHRR
ncbi:glycosyltransferase family 4 protein [Sphingomonas sp. Leaf339]|uniref:glycosyltransferase family 4 protein n=1 Tax=Sphingomonas sp. Leaf339 TaxID=1736343 RepID=UPI00138ECDE3|nr:glycosyltransferase family 4 protein [Sphingomonas sp. Leaf339]